MSRRILRHALESFKHQIEFAYIGIIAFAAVGAWHFVFTDEFSHIFLCHGLNRDIKRFLFYKITDEIIGTVTHFAGFAVNKRVVEGRNMAGCNPNLRVHKYGTVNSDVIFRLLHKLLPPCAFNIVLQLRAEGAVVPCVGKAAVYLRTTEYKTAVLAQRDDFVHGFFGVIHIFSLHSVSYMIILCFSVAGQLCHLPIAKIQPVYLYLPIMLFTPAVLGIKNFSPSTVSSLPGSASTVLVKS